MILKIYKFLRIPKKSDFLNDNGVRLHGWYPILFCCCCCCHFSFFLKKHDIENISIFSRIPPRFFNDELRCHSLLFLFFSFLIFRKRNLKYKKKSSCHSSSSSSSSTSSDLLIKYHLFIYHHCGIRY
jgi:hypothetical protein